MNDEMKLFVCSSSVAEDAKDHDLFNNSVWVWAIMEGEEPELVLRRDVGRVMGFTDESVWGRTFPAPTLEEAIKAIREMPDVSVVAAYERSAGGGAAASCDILTNGKTETIMREDHSAATAMVYLAIAVVEKKMVVSSANSLIPHRRLCQQAENLLKGCQTAFVWSRLIPFGPGSRWSVMRRDEASGKVQIPAPTMEELLNILPAEFRGGTLEVSVKAGNESLFSIGYVETFIGDARLPFGCGMRREKRAYEQDKSGATAALRLLLSINSEENV